MPSLPFAVVRAPIAPPEVIAFVEPSVTGALASLRAHASQISTAAFTGLILADDGRIIDRLDRAALKSARDAHVRASVLVQNLDERDGGWRPDRVRALARDPRARLRFVETLARICVAEHLTGVHLDLEELDEDWHLLTPIVADVARLFRPAQLEVAVDVAASLDDEVLSTLGATADRIVVMAYDEYDADGVPGPIASNDYVADSLRAAVARVPTDKLTAGLAIYGYDWLNSEPADPISFVDAHVAAKEAHVEPRWDRAGNVRFQYSDDEGHHQIWLTDAASIWNQVRVAAASRVRTVALWRLGGEDPAIWSALAHPTAAPDWSVVPPDARVVNLGDGPFLSLSLAPEAGRRQLRLDGERIVDERWPTSPSPFLVRRAGVMPGKVALTFDDGPDPRFTAQILDILRREQVPATFFVIGTQAATAPALVRRAYAEGHEIGNHSFTHPNVDAVGELRLRTELETTSQLIESLVGRRPLMYRPPSLADIEPRTVAGATAFARAGSLGYLVVDADVDPRDWEQPSAAELTRDTLEQAENGGVILLHDGGGDRSTTVRALPAIIAGLRARGLGFVPLSELVGKRRDEVMPLPPKRGLGYALSRRMVTGSVGAFSFLRAVLLATLLLVGLRALAVIAAALAYERRRQRTRPRGPLPSVTAVIPAFNEALVIERTIDSVLASDVPVEVVVVDDGSGDETADVVAHRYRREPRVRLLRQVNAGKAAALRAGIAVCPSEVIVALDGDTLFAPTTVRRLIEPLSDPAVGAVAGTAEVGNLENALGRWQALEYLTQQELERRAWSLAGAVPIVPGAVGAWRRRAVVEAGGFSSDTLAEDADLAMLLCRRGWRVVHAPSARARTEAPTTVRALWKQRARWSFGVLQALWKHRHAPVELCAGRFGSLVWPAMILFQLLLPLATPAALLALAVAAVAGHVQPALIAAALLLVVEAAQCLTACLLAQRSGARHAWQLAPSLLTVRLLYRPLLLVLSLRSIGRLLDGVPLGWGKLARRNTVIGYPLPATVLRAAR